MNNEKVIERAKKLLAMSQDKSSPAEAEIAAKRLRKMMSENDISIEELRGSEFIERIILTYRRIPDWVLALASATALLTDTRAAVGVAKTKQALVFQGVEVDVKLANLMLPYLIESAERDLFDSEIPPDSSGSFYKGYAEAVLEKIRSMIHEEQKQRKEKAENKDEKSVNQLAVIAEKQDLIVNHFGELPKTKTFNFRAEDYEAYSQGSAYGNKLNINKQIKST